MPPPPFDYVRMRGFGPVAAVADVLALLNEHTRPLPPEAVPPADAAGRVLAAGVTSHVNVPGFDRAAMDGYAVRAADTGPPGELVVVGHALPGRPFAGELRPGQAVRIMTGAPLPTGADAVVMVERTELNGDAVRVCEAVAAGRNVGRAGEDVAAGREVLSAGRLLRPQDVGLLAAVGVGTVSVVRRPRVAIVVTGDELLPPGSLPEGFRIVDSNSPMLAALTARDGGVVPPVRRVSDHFEAVRDALADAAATADLVLVSGGTSVGSEDHAPRAVASLGELAIHGVAVKPAKPVGVGFLPTPVFLLPGNPVSCLCAYDLFAGRVVRRLGGRPWGFPHRSATGVLTTALASAAGRVDYVRVKVEAGRVDPLTAGWASALSGAVAADGFVLVPTERERVEAGEAVEVWLYD